MPGWFAGFLAVACVALCVLVVLQRRQVDGLADQLRILTDQIGRSALPVGEILRPLDSFGATPETPEQQVAALSFGDGRLGTLLFVHDASCGACAEALPRVEALAREYGALGVRALGVQLDARDPTSLVHAGSLIEIRGVPMNEGTWLKRVPVLPSLLLVDGGGVVRGAWYGVPLEAQWTQIQEMLAKAARGWRESP